MEVKIAGEKSDNLTKVDIFINQLELLDAYYVLGNIFVFCRSAMQQRNNLKIKLE